MNKHIHILYGVFVAACLSCLFDASAHAQEATRMRSAHAIGIDAGLESAFITRVGYTYGGDFLGEDSRAFARFTLPVVAPDFGDFALDGGLRMHLYQHQGWGVQALAGPIMRHTENELFAATAFGASASVLPGYQSEKWGLLLDLGIEQMVTTQIEHSDLYKETFYRDAKSGFYALASGTLHAGLRSGIHFGKLELSLRAGMLTDTELKPQISPFYFMLGSAYAL